MYVKTDLVLGYIIFITSYYI
uniref:Uncharacterized protein n=1 Tax=Anguilla anguilla TaxID=7936 RepID=A0A0E9RE22_ANGAN